MPNGPSDQRRPANIMGCAATVTRIATGEIEDATFKKLGRICSGHAGAKAGAESLTKEERRIIVAKVAAARMFN